MEQIRDKILTNRKMNMKHSSKQDYQNKWITDINSKTPEPRESDDVCLNCENM